MKQGIGKNNSQGLSFLPPPELASMKTKLGFANISNEENVIISNC